MVTLKLFRSGEPKASLSAQGDTARDRRSWREALEFYRRHLEIEPDDAAIWVQFGHCNKEIGDRAGAERAYLRALSLEPTNADTCVQLGHVEKLNGDADQALAWYRKALRIDASFEPALHEVREAEAIAKRLAEAAKGADTSLETRIAADVDKRVAAMADQIAAIKAMAVELHRVRRNVEGIDARLLQQQAAIGSVQEALIASRDAHGERLNALEARVPTAQQALPALLSRLTELNSQRAEIDAFRNRIDAVEKQFLPPGR